MRNFETKIQELKTSVLTEVSRLTWEDRTQTGILDIPEKIIPGPGASLRCCIYKERAIINSRVKLAMGGDKANPCVVEVLPIACDECPVTEITVGDSCRGCLATRCVHACPKDAISIVNHRAHIDHDKCVTCGRCVNACQYSAIVKTQRRANALKNVVIPNLESTVKFISDSLDEKDREEFSRLKVIKAQKTAKAKRLAAAQAEAAKAEAVGE